MTHKLYHIVTNFGTHRPIARSSVTGQIKANEGKRKQMKANESKWKSEFFVPQNVWKDKVLLEKMSSVR